MINTLEHTCLESPVGAGSVRLRTSFIKSGSLSSARIYRKAVVCLALLPILAVTPSIADTLPDFSRLVEEQADTVVKISVLTSEEQVASSGFPGLSPDQIPEQFRRFFEQMPQNPDPAPREGAGFGSGFIISEDGYIITNAHVVDNATEIKVGLNNRREYTAKLIGSDPASDIALLKLDAEDLPAVTIGNSEKLKVGEWDLSRHLPADLQTFHIRMGSPPSHPGEPHKTPEGLKDSNRIRKT